MKCIFSVRLPKSGHIFVKLVYREMRLEEEEEEVDEGGK